MCTRPEPDRGCSEHEHVDMKPGHLETFKAILTGHIPEDEVRAFDSPATTTAKGCSYVDLTFVEAWWLQYRERLSQLPRLRSKESEVVVTSKHGRARPAWDIREVALGDVEGTVNDGARF